MAFENGESNSYYCPFFYKVIYIYLKLQDICQTDILNEVKSMSHRKTQFSIFSTLHFTVQFAS